MAVREYKGNAVATTLVADITSTSLTFQIASTTGWPTGGVNGKFWVVFNRGQATEEAVLCLSRSGSTITVESTSDRGKDDTSAAGHFGGESVEHTSSADDFREANAHINTTTRDDHTQYMKTDGTRHDLAARHTFGVLGWTPSTPTTILPDDAASLGTDGHPARGDHKHAIAAAAAVDIGTALSEGASTSFARADHGHKIGAGAINAASLFGAGVVDSAALAAASVIAGKLAAGSINAQNLFTNESVPPTGVGISVNTYTPTLFNITLGTGGSPTNTALWIKVGRIVIVWGLIILGNTGDVTGDISIGLPSGQNAYDPSIPSFCYLGAAQGLDGTTRWASVGVIRPDTNPDRISAFGTAGQSWDNTNPFNWGAGDLMRWFTAYITAAV